MSLSLAIIFTPIYSINFKISELINTMLNDTIRIPDNEATLITNPEPLFANMNMFPNPA